MKKQEEASLENDEKTYQSLCFSLFKSCKDAKDLLCRFDYYHYKAVSWKNDFDEASYKVKLIEHNCPKRFFCMMSKEVLEQATAWDNFWTYFGHKYGSLGCLKRYCCIFSNTLNFVYNSLKNKTVKHF